MRLRFRDIRVWAEIIQDHKESIRKDAEPDKTFEMQAEIKKVRRCSLLRPSPRPPLHFCSFSLSNLMFCHAAAASPPLRPRMRTDGPHARKEGGKKLWRPNAHNRCGARGGDVALLPKAIHPSRDIRDCDGGGGEG